MEKLSREELVQQLSNLSVMEMIALTKHLEETWGVKAAPPTVTQVVPQQEQKQEAQTEFTVVLASVPADKKMNVIKAVREVLTLGLKESKDFVEAAPKVMREGISKDEAEAIKVKMTEAGAVIEVK